MKDPHVLKRPTVKALDCFQLPLGSLAPHTTGYHMKVSKHSIGTLPAGFEDFHVQTRKLLTLQIQNQEF